MKTKIKKLTKPKLNSISNTQHPYLRSFFVVAKSTVSATVRSYLEILRSGPHLKNIDDYNTVDIHADLLKNDCEKQSRCSLSTRFPYKLQWALKAFYPTNSIPDVLTHLKKYPLLLNLKHRRTRSKSLSNISETFFHSHLSNKPIENENDFVNQLTEIEEYLVPIRDKHVRARQLVTKLKDINKNPLFSLNLWNPLINYPHKIRNIAVKEATVLNSAKRAPYILYIECERTYKRSSSIRKVRSKSLVNVSRRKDLTDTEVTDNLFNDDDSYVLIPSVEICDAFDDFDIVSYQELILSRIVCHTDTNNLMHVGLNNEDISDNLITKAGRDFSVLGETWKSKVKRISANSRYSNHQNWFLSSCIVKHCEDIRHELIAFQFITQLQQIWRKEKVPVYVCPVNTVLLNKKFAFMYPISDAVSLHQIKCRFAGSLYNYMQKNFDCHLKAQENFVASCAGYSLVCYLLQVRDRHNANILLTNEGHIIHIDFGYILDSSPGNIGFEQADFKITQEYVEVMGGFNSDMYKYYKLLMMQALIAARKHKESLILLIKSFNKWSELKCCRSKTVAERFERRFLPNMTDVDIFKFIDSMVDSNVRSLTTKVYDYYQYQSCGIR
ncbi:hypothetical protein GJ496_010678 [Pomphorhynchus laevis]|nr:hypothetical protein GJ496_010678 [Pomphorhynchus laevis]